MIDELMQTYGYYSEGESFSIADGNEVWIMEIIGKGDLSKGVCVCVCVCVCALYFYEKVHKILTSSTLHTYLFLHVPVQPPTDSVQYGLLESCPKALFVLMRIRLASLPSPKTLQKTPCMQLMLFLLLVISACTQEAMTHFRSLTCTTH